MKRGMVGLRFSDLERMLKAENANIPDDLMITRIKSTLDNFSLRVFAIEFCSEEMAEIPDFYEVDTQMIDRFKKPAGE